MDTVYKSIHGLVFERIKAGGSPPDSWWHGAFPVCSVCCLRKWQSVKRGRPFRGAPVQQGGYIQIMAVRIRLARGGRKKRPFYRIVVASSEAPRDGRFIERIGTYNPLPVNAEVTINRERLEYWLKQGAKPTDTVAGLIRKYGVQAVTEAS